MDNFLFLVVVLAAVWVIVEGSSYNASMPSEEKKCPMGLPAVDQNGKEISCAKASGQTCPTSTYCVIETGDRWAVYCPNTTSLPQSDQQSRCPSGDPVKEQNGCGRGLVAISCRPCTLAPDDVLRLNEVCCCCVVPLGFPPARCESGSPLSDENGIPYRCEFGSRTCPANSQCVVAFNGLIGLTSTGSSCCSVVPQTDTLVGKCQSGTPVKDQNGVEYFCGRGPASRPCPGNSQCNVAPNDAFAVCCESRVEELDQRCPVGKALKDADGVEYFCGRGPSRRDCPRNSECKVAPNDAFAVCCRFSLY